jgi:hypothetical protein
MLADLAEFFVNAADLFGALDFFSGSAEGISSANQ